MRKITALLLALLTLCVLLVSCNDTVSDNSKSDVSVGENEELFSNLPAEKYNTTFTIYVEGDYLDRYKSIEILPNENGPSIIAESVLERNARVEQHFGIEILEIRTADSAEMVTNVQSEIATGTKTYDAVMAYMPNAGTLAAGGALHDLAEFENLHLDRDYWDTTAVESLSVGGKSFFVVGDMNLLAYDCTHCIVFNKDVVADNNLDNPYDLVYDGEWTMDKLLSMAKVVSYENGDGKTDLDDTWGFLINNNYATSLYFGAGETLTSKNTDDLPIISVNGERAVTVFNKIFDICNSDKIALIEDYVGTYDDVYTKASESVASKKALFRSMAVVDIQELGNYECNFGIIPTPKFDEAQDEYYSYVSVIYASSAIIPISAKDAEMSAVILDAMCQASTDTVKTSYYDTMLKYRKLQDDDGVAMLDIIFNNRVFDLAAVYNWGATNMWDANALTTFMNTVAFSGSNTFSSAFESISGTTQSAIDEFVNGLK